MPKGSCLCGGLKYEYTGRPIMKVLCHCLTCRKITGSTNTVCVLVPEEAFRWTAGTPTVVPATHETGMKLSLSICPACGSPMGKKAHADAFAGQWIVFAGTLDDEADDDSRMADAKPAAEIWVKYRANWLAEVAGTNQAPGWP